MKQVNSFGISMSCLLFILFSPSCKKDSLNTASPLCNNCNTLVLNNTFINAGNWIKQEDGSYSCDITSELKQAGVPLGKIQAVYIAEGNPFPQIYPEASGDYLGEPVLFDVSLSSDEGTCILIFELSNFDHYQGGGSKPFSSVEIEVSFSK